MARDSELESNKDIYPELNRDPITGTPGAHPVGTGIGAAAGAAVAGAAVGTVAGPIGTVVGLVAGAVVGGLGGKAVAEGINPTAEDAYWRQTYLREAYHDPARSYDDYGPAYELGWSSRSPGDAVFFDAEPRLSSAWSTRRGASTLEWEDAKPATQAAWERAGRLQAGAVGAPAETAMLSDDDLVDVLNDLLENARDGEYGFRACAQSVDASALQATFDARAEQCRVAGHELMQLIAAFGGNPADGGTTSGALHRGWVHVKGTVGANSEQSILNECERGEDASLSRYRKVLKMRLPAEVHSVLQRQAEGAQRNHDEVKALRDAVRSGA